MERRFTATATLKTLLLAATAVALPLGASSERLLPVSIAAAMAKGPPVGVGKPDGAGKPEGVGNAANADDADDEDDDDDDSDDADDGLALGRTAVMTVHAGAMQSSMRFANFGGQGGTARVVLHDAATGALLGEWQSPIIAGHGALEVGIDAIGAAAGLGARTLAVARISAQFRGQVQHLGWSGMSTPTSLTACARLETPKRALGVIAGPGRAAATGFVQIVNGGAQPRAVTLIVADAATGATLGEWTSPLIAAFAAQTVSVADLADEAGIADTAALLTVRVEGSAAHLGLSYLEGPLGGPLTDLTAGCPLKGGGDGSDDDESDDMDDGEDTGEGTTTSG